MAYLPEPPLAFAGAAAKFGKIFLEPQLRALEVIPSPPSRSIWIGTVWRAPPRRLVHAVNLTADNNPHDKG